MPLKAQRTVMEETLTRFIDQHFQGYMKMYYNKEKERYYIEVIDNNNNIIYSYNYNDIITAISNVHNHIIAEYSTKKDRYYGEGDDRWEIRNQ